MGKSQLQLKKDISLNLSQAMPDKQVRVLLQKYFENLPSVFLVEIIPSTEGTE